MKKQMRPDRWYVVDNKVLFAKYRNLKKYVAGVSGIPVEELDNVTLEELKTLIPVQRIKVKVNRKGTPMKIVGDAITLEELDQLIPLDLDI